MRATDPEVVDTVWAAIEPLLPIPAETHPLGCHRPRLPDRDCFEVILMRLVTGSSWEDCERFCGNKVSDTTARARRDEWEHAGVFAAISDEAIRSYDKILHTIGGPFKGPTSPFRGGNFGDRGWGISVIRSKSDTWGRFHAGFLWLAWLDPGWLYRKNRSYRPRWGHWLQLCRGPRCLRAS